MQKLSIRGAVCAFILIAAVAVFSNVGSMGGSKAGKTSDGGSAKSGVGILTADGGSPYPKPPVTFAVVS